MILRKKKTLIFALVLALLSPQNGLSGAKASSVPEINVKPKYVQGEIIVKYKNTLSTLSDKANLKTKYSLMTKKDLKLVNAEVVTIPKDSSVETMVNKLKLDKNVEAVQPNYLYYAKDFSSDTRGSELWGLENTGQTIFGNTGVQGIDINIKNAWSVTQGSNDVVVGVIDTGIDINHPDLKDRIWINDKEIPHNGIDDDGDGYIDDVYGWDFYNNDSTVYDEKDGDKHGTHVAGTIAASLNGTGVAGVAPNVKIMPLKFIGPFEGTTEDAIKAIEYAKAKGVKILNNSWGGTDYDDLLKSAIDNSGALFVAAAGNEASNNDLAPSYPAAFNSDNVLAVAAVDNQGKLAYFSNYGVSSIQVAAPGVDILSTIPKPGEIGAAVKSDTGTYKTFVQGISLSNIKTQLQINDMLSRSLRFFNIANNDPILVVTDDESSYRDTSSPSYIYKRTLVNIGYTNISSYHVYQNSNGPDLSQMSGYKLIVWITGYAETSTLTYADQSNLASYLNNGGNLYLSGDFLSYELYETDFAGQYLHVNYLQNDDNRRNLVGISTSEFDGQTYDIYDSYYDMMEPSDTFASTVLNYNGDTDYSNSYEYLQGTSMAAPHASGIAALLMSKGVTDPKAMKDKIMMGVMPLSSLSGKVSTGGMINAYNSLQYIKDVNNDKAIDILDLAAVAINYNMKNNDKDWNRLYDFNEDGVVDIFDLVAVSQIIN